MSLRSEPTMLTVEELLARLRDFGPRATVYATEGKISFYDPDEGGREVGSIDTPSGVSE